MEEKFLCMSPKSKQILPHLDYSKCWNKDLKFVEHDYQIFYIGELTHESENEIRMFALGVYHVLKSK